MKKSQKPKSKTKAQKLAEKRAGMKEVFWVDEQLIEKLVREAARVLKLDDEAVERILEAGNESINKSLARRWLSGLRLARENEISEGLKTILAHWGGDILMAFNQEKEDIVQEVLYEKILTPLFSEAGGRS